MKDSARGLIVLAILLFSMVVHGGPCPHALTISIAESWPPAVQKKIESFQQPFKEIGCEVIFKKVPLSRSLLMVSRGELDGDTFRIDAFGSDLPHLVRVQSPMARLKYYFYKKSGSDLNLDQPKSFKWRKTCLTLGNRLRAQVAKELQLQVLEAANTFQCLKMLANGRVDVFIGPTLEVEDPTLKEYNSHFVRAQNPFVTANLYIYLNDRHKDIARALEPLMDKYRINDEMP
ncbi:hypothetical protein ACLSU7_06955 [Bdellovibrio sp. HCB185ZH]|uniref:hypothetical protein n=1 Tax=Bdellovibrio sp. HCB185ZH TaxID=3394235 RepID=UPI0039A618A2